MRQQLGVFLTASQHHGAPLILEAALYQLFYNAHGGWRVGRELYRDAIARCDRANKRREAQHKGIVPRRHDTRHAKRLGNVVALCGKRERA